MSDQSICKLWLKLTLIFLFLLFFPFASSAETIPSLKVDKNNVHWNKLLFKGKEFFAKLTAEVKLISPLKSKLRKDLISSPQGVPISNSESEVLIIDTKISVKSVFAKVKLQNIAWFDPLTLSTMQYVRQRFGLKDAKKIYRFTDRGVFRLTKQPINENEITQLPEKWSDHKERFYTYDSKKKSCKDITAPIPVIYLVSALRNSDFKKQVTICVFNKKEIVYLDIRREPAESVQLNYTEIKGDKVIQKNTLIQADVLSLKAKSSFSDQTAMNNFTLVGLQGNIKIYINPETQVPVQLQGNYQDLGEIKLKLRQMVRN